MKKRILLVFLLSILILIISINIFTSISNEVNSKILSNLEGSIYYTERIDGALTLFKSDASLRNKTLLYSHKGKGKTSLGDYNDNIIDFYYDKETKMIYFVAMHKGSWSLFSLKENESNPELIQQDVMDTKTDYIKPQSNNITISLKKGSLTLLENGNEKVLKKFYGIYDEKFTGYRPIGISPDGKYVVYHTMEHLTSVGTILDGMVDDSVGNYYIMDLSTMKSTNYIDSYNIQWVLD